MILIVGGAYQGKKDFIRQHFLVREEEIVDAAREDIETKLQTGKKAVLCYHEEIRRELLRGEVPEEKLEALLAQYPQLILSADEIGMGIVPMERREREYREAVGRTLCKAAAQAEEVWRVICGLGERIK